MGELTLQAARLVNPRRIGMTLAAIWVFLTVCGLAVAHGYGTWNLRSFSLEDSITDGSISTAATFTSVLMLCAGGMALALSQVDRNRRERNWKLAGWALVALGVEELLGFHGYLQEHGVHWAVAYLPLLALTTAATVAAMPILRNQQRALAQFRSAVA